MGECYQRPLIESTLKKSCVYVSKSCVFLVLIGFSFVKRSTYHGKLCTFSEKMVDLFSFVFSKSFGQKHQQKKRRKKVNQLFNLVIPFKDKEEDDSYHSGRLWARRGGVISPCHVNMSQKKVATEGIPIDFVFLHLPC